MISYKWPVAFNHNERKEPGWAVGMIVLKSDQIKELEYDPDGPPVLGKKAPIGSVSPLGLAFAMPTVVVRFPVPSR